MLKTFLLLIVLTGALFLLSGCGLWGNRGFHGHGHYSSHHHNSQTHYRGGGHPGY